MSTVSLCMVVKNEEFNIRRCLESVHEYVDEIIIVDTGSTDKTKDICLEYTSKLYHFDWKDDFAQARNYCLERATSDWILWLDADEKLNMDKEASEINLDAQKNTVFSVKMVHLYDRYTEEDKECHISYAHRLFPNKKGLYFEGIIHEKIIFDEKSLPVKTADFMDIVHYGYTGDTINTKILRNLKLLMKQREIDKEDPWIDYHIAVELYHLHDSQKAFLSVNQSIAGFIAKQLLPPALVYKLKYDILIQSDSIENAGMGIEKAISLYPDYVELYFYKGIILYQQKLYEDAIKAFQYCLILGEENSNYLITIGNGSFRAYEYIGECYEKLAQYEYALEAYRLSLHYHPRFKEAKEKQSALESKLNL